MFISLSGFHRLGQRLAKPLRPFRYHLIDFQLLSDRWYAPKFLAKNIAESHSTEISKVLGLAQGVGGGICAVAKGNGAYAWETIRMLPHRTHIWVRAASRANRTTLFPLGPPACQ